MGRIYAVEQMPSALNFRENAVYNPIFAPAEKSSSTLLYGHTLKLYRIVRDLMGVNEADRQVVFLKSHIHRAYNDDAIEVRHRDLRSGLALYANNRNELYFSLLNNFKYHEETDNSGRPKIKSSGNNLKDAEMVRKTLDGLISKLNMGGIVVNGPNDLEHLVVIMKESAFPIARSNGLDLLGLILQPNVDPKSLGVGGPIKLLVRER